MAVGKSCANSPFYLSRFVLARGCLRIVTIKSSQIKSNHTWCQMYWKILSFSIIHLMFSFSSVASVVLSLLFTKRSQRCCHASSGFCWTPLCANVKCGRIFKSNQCEKFWTEKKLFCVYFSISILKRVWERATKLNKTKTKRIFIFFSKIKHQQRNKQEGKEKRKTI